MRTFTVIFLFFATLAAYAHESDDSDHFIRNVNELSQWCKSEAQYRYMLQNIPTYNWSAKTFNKGNMIQVKGRLKVNYEYVTIDCRAVVGSRREDAIIEIDDPSLPSRTIVVEPASGVNVIVR